MDSFDRSMSPGGDTTDEADSFQQPASSKQVKQEGEKPVNEPPETPEKIPSISRKSVNYKLSMELHAEMSKNVELHNKYIRAAEILRKIDQENQDLLDVFLSMGQEPSELATVPTVVMSEEQQERFDLLH